MPITSETKPPPPGWGSNWAVAGWRAIRELEDARIELEVVKEMRDHFQKRAENHWSDHYADLKKTQVEAADKIRAEAAKNDQRVKSLRAELKASRKREADKDKQIEQHNSAIQAVNSAANSAVAAANAERQQALADKEELSKEKDLNDKQVQMMQTEVERLEGEVLRAYDQIKAAREEVERAWIDSLNEDGDQLDTNPKFVQVVQQNVVLTALKEQNEQTIAELTDRVKDLMTANDEQTKGQDKPMESKAIEETASAGNKTTATAENRGTKREGDQLSEGDDRGKKKLKPDQGAKKASVKIEFYVYDIHKEAFNFETEKTAFLPDQGAFKQLEKICGNTLPAPSQGEYTTMIKAENIVNHGSFDDVDRHRFHDWVKAVNTIGQEVRICRYFAHIPNNDDAKVKAKAAADQVQQLVN